MDFNMYLRKFAFSTEKGREYIKTKQLGFDKVSQKLITMKIQVQTYGALRDSRKDKLPAWNSWELFLT